MGVNCAGEHECDPGYFPAAAEETWTCPETGCGRVFTAFPAAAMRIPEVARRHLRPGQLGWTSSSTRPQPA